MLLLLIFTQQIINEGDQLIYQLDIFDDNPEEIEIELITDEDINYSISSGYILTLSTLNSDFYGELDISVIVSDSEYSSTKILNLAQPKIENSKLINLMNRNKITFKILKNTLKKFKKLKIHLV